MKQAETEIAKRILVAVQTHYGLDCLGWINRTGVAKSFDGKRTISYGRKGSPDILMCIKGVFVGIEVKTPTGSQEQSQKDFQREFERAGGIYIIGRDPKGVLQRLQKIIK